MFTRQQNLACLDHHRDHINHPNGNTRGNTGIFAAPLDAGAQNLCRLKVGDLAKGSMITCTWPNICRKWDIILLLNPGSDNITLEYDFTKFFNMEKISSCMSCVYNRYLNRFCITFT